MKRQSGSESCCMSNKLTIMKFRIDNNLWKVRTLNSYETSVLTVEDLFPYNPLHKTWEISAPTLSDMKQYKGIFFYLLCKDMNICQHLIQNVICINVYLCVKFTLTRNFNFSYPNGGFLLSILSSIDMKILVLIERVRLGPRIHSPHTLGFASNLGNEGCIQEYTNLSTTIDHFISIYLLQKVMQKDKPRNPEVCLVLLTFPLASLILL